MTNVHLRGSAVGTTDCTLTERSLHDGLLLIGDDWGIILRGLVHFEYQLGDDRGGV